MKVATFNVNSIRQRLPIVVEWLCEHEPDILAVQETKVEDSKFPHQDFEDCGYYSAYNGQKGTNGVAIFSRKPLSNVRRGFEDPLFPEDARIIAGEYDGVHIINTYIPNGTAVGTDKFVYKLRWLERFKRMIEERYRPTDKVLWMGDINIAPTSDDIYNPKRFYGVVGHHPLEFEALGEIVDWGWTDVFRKFHKGPGHYTYWDYVILTSVEKNFGWRIDHIYASPALAEKAVCCEIDRAPRSLLKPSDHTPVWAEFDV